MLTKSMYVPHTHPSSSIIPCPNSREQYAPQDRCHHARDDETLGARFRYIAVRLLKCAASILLVAIIIVVGCVQAVYVVCSRRCWKIPHFFVCSKHSINLIISLTKLQCAQNRKQCCYCCNTHKYVFTH